MGEDLLAPVLWLSYFDHMLALITVANFTFGVIGFPLFLTKDSVEAVAEYTNRFTETFEKISQKSDVLGVDVMGSLRPISEEFNTQYEKASHSVGHAAAALVAFQKICFFILSFYGLVLIGLAAYEHTIGLPELNTLLFCLNSVVLLVAAVLFVFRKRISLDESRAQNIVIISWGVLVVLMFILGGGLSPQIGPDFISNSQIVYPYTLFTISLGFAVFFFGSMIIKSRCKKAKSIYEQAEASLQTLVLKWSGFDLKDVKP